MKTNIDTALVLLNILSKPGMTDVEGVLGYAIYKNLRILQNECEDFNKVRDNLIKKYGTEKDGTYSIDTKDEKSYTSFMKEIEPLLKLELDINYFQIDQVEFDKLYCSGLSTKDYMILEQVLVKPFVENIKS